MLLPTGIIKLKKPLKKIYIEVVIIALSMMMNTYTYCQAGVLKFQTVTLEHNADKFLHITSSAANFPSFVLASIMFVFVVTVVTVNLFYSIPCFKFTINVNSH